MATFNNLVLTPIDGSDVISLPHIGEINGPINGVITFSFEEFIGDFAALLEPVAATNVQHLRNRVGTYQAVSDPSPKGVTATYKEIHPFEDGVISKDRSHNGIISITGQTNSSSRNAFRLTFYVCSYRYERATRVEESLF